MRIATLTLIAALAAPSLAFADPGHGNNTGNVGKAADVNREIDVEMGEMFFKTSAPMKFKAGETVKFVVVNTGKLIHEFNIGDLKGHKAHEKEMRKMMRKKMVTMTSINHDKMKAAGMMHDDPNSVLLEPGQEAEVIWQFTEDADGVLIACNVPGHRQGGMVAEVTVIGTGS